jgi:hypothetical protein
MYKIIIKSSKQQPGRLAWNGSVDAIGTEKTKFDTEQPG